MNMIAFSRKIPVKYNVDVFVAGGGPSGIAAAVVAARQGAKVFLAEGTACFGGMGTSAGLPLFCSPTDGVNVTSSGFGTDVYEGLWKEGGTSPFMKRSEPYSNFCFNGEILKRVYDNLAKKSKMDFSFHTNFMDVSTRNGNIEHAICSAKSGIFAVKAKIYIDATGDGDLCAQGGAPFKKGDENGYMQPGTLCSLWCDIDWKKAMKSNCGVWQQDKYLPEAIKDKVFTIPDPHLPGMLPVGLHSAWGNVGHTFGVDGTDERSLTKALLWGRQLVKEYEKFYKKYLKGYEKMQLLGTGALLGVRETRRIMGDYVLDLEDFKKRAKFDDEIARFSYPVDLHPPRPNARSFRKFEEIFKKLRYERGENYGIPYRSLIPKKLKNVLVVGRSISCDRYIQGSVRVMPGCYITGQAAGMAAAIASDKGLQTRQVDIRELQGKLVRIGAFLPNFKK